MEIPIEKIWMAQKMMIKRCKVCCSVGIRGFGCSLSGSFRVLYQGLYPFRFWVWAGAGWNIGGLRKEFGT